MAESQQYAIPTEHVSVLESAVAFAMLSAAFRGVHLRPDDAGQLMDSYLAGAGLQISPEDATSLKGAVYVSAQNKMSPIFQFYDQFRQGLEQLARLKGDLEQQRLEFERLQQAVGTRGIWSKPIAKWALGKT